MKSIEVSARTIEEAVAEGLQKLNCSISDCKVEILEEGAKGLFGFFGSKPASVRLTLTDGDDDPIDMPTLDESPSPRSTPKEAAKPVEKKQQPKKSVPEKPTQEKSKMRIASNPQVVDKPSDVLERFRKAPLPGSSAGSTGDTGEKPAKAKSPRPPKQHVPREEHHDDYPRTDDRTPVPVPEHVEMHDPATPEGIAQQFLLGVTERMGVDVKVEVTRAEDGHLFVTMYGDTLGILIGRRGETLDALQYLTSLQVNKDREEYIRVTLDTENYRAKREEALTRLASRMASRAIKTGRKVSLEPMNPYERRILHSSLQGNPEVTTHSEGDEPFRHVVVVPVK